MDDYKYSKLGIAVPCKNIPDEPLLKAIELMIEEMINRKGLKGRLEIKPNPDIQDKSVVLTFDPTLSGRTDEDRDIELAAYDKYMGFDRGN